MNGNDNSGKDGLRLPVILIPGIIFLVLLLWGFLDSFEFIKTLNGAFETMMYSLGWIVSLSMLFFLVFCSVIIFHRVGNIRLGGPNAKPKMSYCSGLPSLFAPVSAPESFSGALRNL